MSNLPAGVTQEMIPGCHGPDGIEGERCGWCGEDAADDLELEDQLDAQEMGHKPRWELQNRAGVGFCCESCRMARQIHEGAPRDEVRRLYELLRELSEVSSSAWFALEEAGILSVLARPSVRADDGYMLERARFLDVADFRYAIDEIANEMWSDSPVDWTKEAKPRWPTAAMLADKMLASGDLDEVRR